MKLVTAAASKVSLCLIFFHINYPQANQFYDASDDWNKKQAVIESISHIYHNLPNPTLNFSETKFKSLYIPSEWFIAEKNLLKVDLQDKRESLTSVIGVGGAFARSNNSTFVAYGGWSSQCLKCGAAFVLRYEGDSAESIYFEPVAGVSAPVRVQNSNSKEILHPTGFFFSGHDEAEGFVQGADNEDGALAGKSYYFDLSELKFKEVSSDLYEGHFNYIFDWNKDGLDDILRAGWSTGLGLWLNKGASFDHIPLDIGGSTLAARHRPSGSVMVFVGDAVGDPIKPEPYNVIRTYDSDIESGITATILSRERFIDPMLEGKDYNNVDSNYADFKSHEVASSFVDLDHDGDEDLIVSSMIWGDQPYDVLQIYIYQDGNWTDETQDRIHNYHMVGNGNHATYFYDVNHDGFVDILTSDHGFPDTFIGENNYESAHFKGERVLLNDGTGHFSVVIREQVSPPELQNLYTSASVPWLSNTGMLRWTLFRIRGSSVDTVDVHTRALERRLSTGPNGLDPAEFNEPDFNEFYYLLNNPDASAQIKSGNYVNGLDHYLKKGKAQGLTTHRNHPDLAEEYIFDGSVCKASDPRESIELQSRESGLTNSSSTKTIEVNCPVWSLAQEGEANIAARSDYFMTIKNLSVTSAEFSCALRELTKEEVNFEVFSLRNLSSNATSVNAWRNITTSNTFSSLHINCSLPPSGVITELKVRTYNS